MGHRIKLSENITRALKRMKCPFPLDAHQIQGGVAGADYPNIFPVIQWLVKKVRVYIEIIKREGCNGEKLKQHTPKKKKNDQLLSILFEGD
jgi:hypothetical protein